MIAWLGLLACAPDDSAAIDDTGIGLVGDGLDNPFPSLLWTTEAGLDLDAGPLPSGGATPLPHARVAWRTGFSPAQVSVVVLDGVRTEALPRWQDPTPGEGGVVLADLTAGRFLPVFAELDAWEGAARPALLIRPLEAIPAGHRVGVAVTTAAVDRPARFDALLAGDPPASLADRAASLTAVVDDLEGLGLARSAIALAWEYPVGDGTTPLRSALEQYALPGGWTFDRIREADNGDLVAGPTTWRAVEGTFRVTDFLVDDRTLDLSADGSVVPTGEADAEIYVHIPTSVRDAAAGSVPVLVLGHGIFSEPSNYLDDASDPSGVLALAEAGGFIVVGTLWRGLTWDDRLGAIEVAGDFGQLPVISDRLVQGQVNVRTLVDLVREGGLGDDPALRGAQGQSLVDPDAVYYYGISLGGIEGAVFLAQDPPVRAGVLHVGGAMWATMLERSSNWPVFELLLTAAVPDSNDRQLLYAWSQLFWDVADPISYTASLAETPFLLQESIGDEQVPNLTTEALARSVGLPVLGPAVAPPFGLTVVDGPLVGPTSALVQFDPEVPLPAEVNRPAPVTGAHDLPRRWAGTRAQILDYLLAGRTVVHHCGDAPCSDSNQGD